MAQIFHRSTNLIARVSIFGALVIIGALGFALYEIALSPWYTDQNVTRQQPVPFSHGTMRASSELTAAIAILRLRNRRSPGLPPTQTCMTCHSQIWTNSSMLEPVRASYRDDTVVGMDARKRSARLRLLRSQHSRC